jgi:hypothetical protein
MQLCRNSKLSRYIIIKSYVMYAYLRYNITATPPPLLPQDLTGNVSLIKEMPGMSASVNDSIH